MADADPNKKYDDERAALRDTAKWIVTILGATVVLVIGGGLVGKIADLDATPRMYAAGCLVGLTILCLVPLKWAIDIVSTPLAPLKELATSGTYRSSRDAANGLIALYQPPLNSVESLYNEYVRLTGISNNANATPQVRAAADADLDELAPRFLEANQLTNTAYLRLAFKKMVCVTVIVLPLIGAALLGFLYFLHTETASEKPLPKPMLMNAPPGTDIAAALKQAGVADTCVAGAKLLQLSDLSGLRAGVLIVPQNLGPDCPAVRAVISNTGQITVGN